MQVIHWSFAFDS